MFGKFKGIVAGFIVGAIFSGCIVATATGSLTTLYNVLNSGIRIVIDGQELNPTDANGNKVEPMIYEGTTYLPVRAVASALGKAVYWDGPSYTVYLGDMDGKLEYPTAKITDLTSITHKPAVTKRLTDNYGHRYSSAIDNSYSKLEYLLAMRYSRFKGTLYIPEGVTSNNTVYLTITADGHIIYTSPEMTKASSPVSIDVNVSGYNDVVIEWSSSNGYYGIDCYLADAGFYQ